jgi:phosphoglycolate phosphatase-like HAD superfamily hydrolase
LTPADESQDYPRVVFMDLDGTIVEFCIDYRAARREALDLLEKYPSLQGLKFTLDDSIFKMDREIRLFIERTKTSKEHYLEIHEKLLSILDNYEMQAARKTKLFPYAKETLEELRDMGLKLVLFTADGDSAMNAIVDRTGIGEYFETLVSRGSSMEVKPHPNHITSAVSLVGSKLGESIVVGDSAADIASGKCIRATTVGVTSGLGTRQQLEEVGVDYLLGSIAELPPLIRKIWGEAPYRSSTR